MFLQILRISNKGLSVRKNYIFPFKHHLFYFYIRWCDVTLLDLSGASHS